MKLRTLRGRLALVAVLSTAVGVLLVTIVVDAVFVHELRSRADDVLRTRAAAAAAALRESADGVEIDQGRLDSPVWVVVGGTIVDAPVPGSRLDHEVSSLARRGGGFRDVDSPDVRLYARRVRAAHTTTFIVSSVDLDPYTRSTQLVLGGSAVLAALLIGTSYPITRIAVAKALRPVADMSDRAARWSADDVHQRFGAAARYQELEQLSRDLDGMLDRIGAVLRHEQQLSAEISHELRTPLARIVAEAELLQAATPPDESLAPLHAIALSAQQMDSILGTLLATARSTSTQTPGRCDLAEAVEQSVGETCAASGVPVHVGVPHLLAGVAPAVAIRILVPLLQNARRFARTAVTVTAEPGDGAVHVFVEDDGPGFGVLRDTAFEPGVRGGDDDEGAGLGLSLSRRLARANGGDVTLHPTQSGARLDVRLPAG
jgi:signal transduction histidine kinase